MEIPLPEPSPITTALVEQIKNATDALALAGFTPYPTPQAAAEAHPEVFAALIEAQGTGRIAALGWSVAPATSEAQEAQEGPAEAGAAQEPPTTPSATPGGHPLDQGGWIRSRLPTEGDADGDGDVVIPVWRARAFLPWSHVVPGQPWRRFS